jgi:hypothetical protein
VFFLQGCPFLILKHGRAEKNTIDEREDDDFELVDEVAELVRDTDFLEVEEEVLELKLDSDSELQLEFNSVF